MELYLFDVCFYMYIMISIEVFIFLYFKGDVLCKNCFYFVFEEEVYKIIIDVNLFVRGETVVIGVLGGKG